MRHAVRAACTATRLSTFVLVISRHTLSWHLHTRISRIGTCDLLLWPSFIPGGACAHVETGSQGGWLLCTAPRMNTTWPIIWQMAGCLVVAVVAVVHASAVGIGWLLQRLSAVTQGISASLRQARHALDPAAAEFMLTCMCRPCSCSHQDTPPQTRAPLLSLHASLHALCCVLRVACSGGGAHEPPSNWRHSNGCVVRTPIRASSSLPVQHDRGLACRLEL